MQNIYLVKKIMHPKMAAQAVTSVHCNYLNAWSECNDIVISVYSHYPLDSNAKSSDTKGTTFSIRWFCIRIERVMTAYGNYDVIAFRSCIQIFTVHLVELQKVPLTYSLRKIHKSTEAKNFFLAHNVIFVCQSDGKCVSYLRSILIDKNIIAPKVPMNHCQ